MIRLLVLPLLVACGDDRTVDTGFDAGFDDREHSRYFGVVVDVQSASSTPISGLEVCIDAACATTDPGGSFVIVGPGPEREWTLVAMDADHVPTIVPVVGGVAGDRNLDSILMIGSLLMEQTATAFGVDPMLASRGAVLIVASRHDTKTIELAIEGHTTRYLDDRQLPDPTRTTLSQAGGAVIYGVLPGEVILHATTGRCDVANTGWRGASGELRLPVVVGALTIVNPICTGD